MAKNKDLFKYVLWIIIILSLIILITASYKQLKRFQATKNMDIILDSYERPYIEPNKLEVEIEIDVKEYSTEPNLQKEWLDLNNDYQGWLLVEGTNIDYPVVRAIDNKFYLNRDFLKEKNELGAIFMDYRNIGNFNDRHTAIYGHFTWNGKMFADLHKYKEEDFSKENNVIKFNTLYGEKEFEIFSVYIDSASDYQLKLDFEDDKEYVDYLYGLNALSIHNFDFTPLQDKLLITLATCSYEIGNGRLIVHAIEK